MSVSDRLELDPPTSDDLDVSRAAWRAGRTQCFLEKTAVWWRVLRADSAALAEEYARTTYASAARNGFTPIRDANGIIVPAAYIAETRETALWEVILRHLRHDAIRIIPFHLVRAYFLVPVALARPVKALDLRKPQDLCLVGAGKPAPDLISARRHHYNQTRQWTQALYQCIPNVGGFIYTSHQTTGHSAVVLQSEVPDAFIPLERAVPVSAEPIRSLLISEAEKVGAAIDFGDDEDDRLEK